MYVVRYVHGCNVCMHVDMIYEHLCAHIRPYIHTYILIRTNDYTCLLDVCVCMDMHVHAPAYMYVHMSVCTRMRRSMRFSVSACLHVHGHVCVCLRVIV